jgi:hypothetical protein
MTGPFTLINGHNFPNMPLNLIRDLATHSYGTSLFNSSDSIMFFNGLKTFQLLIEFCGITALMTQHENSSFLMTIVWIPLFLSLALSGALMLTWHMHIKRRNSHVERPAVINIVADATLFVSFVSTLSVLAVIDTGRTTIFVPVTLAWGCVWKFVLYGIVMPFMYNSVRSENNRPMRFTQRQLNTEPDLSNTDNQFKEMAGVNMNSMHHLPAPIPSAPPVLPPPTASPTSIVVL